MKTIDKPKRNIHEHAIAEAQRLGFSHYRIAKDAIVLGTKAELKRGSYANIYTVHYEEDDPDTWGTARIPIKGKRVWSDEYYAQKEGLALRKGVGR